MIENQANETRFAFVASSGNRKCDGMVVTTSTENTCPWNCGLFLECYGRGGNTAMHWTALNNGTRASVGIDELCDLIRSLPIGEMWRHNEAGDLDGDRRIINRESLEKIVCANKGRRGFTYTHYNPFTPSNACAIYHANKSGFTVNLSADSLVDADRYANLDIGPVCVTIPIDAPNVSKTPEGRTIVKCMNAQNHEITCDRCKWCAKTDRRFIVGFPAHGYARKRLSARCAACSGSCGGAK